MIGAVIGDIVGSAYEFNNCRRKDFDPLFHAKARFTDDTVCTIAIADALINQTDAAATLRQWCMKYGKNGGWGQKFILWIADDDAGPYGSFGNGGAMRVSPVALLAKSLDEVYALSTKVTEITHNHPEGLIGAQATAVSIFLALNKMPVSEIRNMITGLFGYDLTKSVDEIRPSYRHTERASDSVPQALTCAFESMNYVDALRNAVSIGGDSDTISAIAGSVAEALWGIDDEIAAIGKSYLPLEFVDVLDALYKQSFSGRKSEISIEVNQ